MHPRPLFFGIKCLLLLFSPPAVFQTVRSAHHRAAVQAVSSGTSGLWTQNLLAQRAQDIGQMRKQGGDSKSGRQTTGKEQEIGGETADPLTAKRMDNVLSPRQERPGQ